MRVTTTKAAQKHCYGSPSKNKKKTRQNNSDGDGDDSVAWYHHRHRIDPVQNDPVICYLY